MGVIYQKDIHIAHRTLERGHILGVPTDTVYGLAVKSDNTQAIKKLLTLKDSPIGSDKVLTMMLSDVDQMKEFVELDKRKLRIARHYLPGELTILLPKRKDFKHPYFDNFDKIGIRIADHDFIMKLVNKSGPLLITSANLRGEAPCRNHKEFAKRLPSVEHVVEGNTKGGIPSTIIDWTEDEPKIIRQGGLLIVRY